MKIIHVVVGKANPDKMNGINKVVHELITTQSQQGYNVELWGLTKNPIHNYPPRSYRTVLFRLGSSYRLDRNLTQVIADLKSAKVVFHFHGAFTLQFNKLSKLVLSKGHSYVVSLHGGYNSVALKRSRALKKLFTLAYDKKYLHRARGIHVFNPDEIHTLKKEGISGRPKIIPNGQMALVRKKNHQQSNVHFVFCGRLDIQTKGLDILLKGFALVQNQLNKSCLTIVGDGELAALKSQAKSMGLSNVVFTGALFGEEKNEVIRTATMLVLCSRNEGLPGVVLESFALGVPVIVSSETNMGPYVEKYGSGICLEENTPEQLAEAMKAASEWSLQERRNRSAWSIQVIEAEFNWNRIVAQFNELYAA